MTDPTPETPGSDSINFMSPAIAYAQQGWRVLPVHEGEKRPALAAWPEKATTSIDTIKDWWTQHNFRNIGLACGRESGFFVLDIDPKDGGDEALESLEIENGPLPLTRKVRTGSGGSHYYFLMPDFEVTNSPGRLKGMGIDVRGEGGQVLAPPSVTVFGSYDVVHDGPIVAAPDWLLDMIKPRLEIVQGGGGEVQRVDAEDFDRQRHYAVNVALPAAARAVAEARKGLGRPKEGRNWALNNNVLSLAGIAAHDPALLDRDEVFDAMQDACVANSLIADDGAASFRATFKSAWAAGLTKPRGDWPPRELVAGGDLYFGPHATMPIVNISARRLNELVDEVMTNISEANLGNPTLFTHGTEVVQVVGQPGRTSALDHHGLAYYADTQMQFIKNQPNGGTAIAHPPAKIIETIMSKPEKPLPPLVRLSYTPFFSPTGRYVVEPGYDEESKTFYAPALGVTVPPIPERPTAAETSQALKFLMGEMLVDFPFVSEADQAHALALMLLPFVRDMIGEGATPLHNIEAPTPGSGKGLLMKALLTPAVGGRQKVIGAASTNEEWEKKLISSLRLSPQAIVIDNVNDRVNSAFLCTVLTEPEVSSRLLGVSVDITVPVRTTWVMTANNPKFSDEVVRRTIRIRLDSQTEHPEDRSGFRHDNLAAWAQEHRGELIAACCTLIQSWVVAGAPWLNTDRPLGSFETWHRVMGGLLEHLGVEGLLSNKSDFMAMANDEGSAWDQLIEILSLNVDGEWSANTIADIVASNGIAIDLGRGDNKALAMGKELGKQRDRWHSGKQFQSRTVRGLTRWFLVERASKAVPDL